MVDIYFARCKCIAEERNGFFVASGEYLGMRLCREWDASAHYILLIFDVIVLGIQLLYRSLDLEMYVTER